MKQLFRTGSLVLLSLFFVAAISAANGKSKKKPKTVQTENKKPQDASDIMVLPNGKPTPGEMVNAPIQQKIPLDPSVRYGVLPNGMHYYIKKNNKPENRIEMRLAVNAGANQEDDSQKGLAHFVEHMAFNGSEHFAKNDLVNFLEGLGVKFGAHLNAYTSFDETVYMLQLPADKKDAVEKGMTVLQDWAGGLSFDHSEIDKERGVVVSEWRSGLGPDQRMLYKWLPVMYYQSRYAERLPIGDTGILNRAPYERLTTFYKDWYRPDLMSVMIVGDVNVDSMEQAIKQKFSGLKNPTGERKKELYTLPEHDKTLVSIVTDPEATISNIIMEYKHPAQDMSTVDGYRNFILNGLMNSMLNRRLQEIAQQPDPPFLQADAGYYRETRMNDAFNAQAYAKSGKATAALQALLTELERAKRFGFTQSELGLAKKEYEKNIEDALKEKDKTESRSLIREYVDNFLRGEAAPGIEKEYELTKQLLPSINLEAINQRIKEYITDKNSVVVITAPEEEKKFLPWENDVLDMVAKTKADNSITAYEDKTTDQPLFSATPIAGTIVKETKSDSFNITTLELSNGVRVIVKPTDFKNDEILFSSYSPGGTSLYVDADFMSADYSNYIISESGLANFDKLTLQKMLVGKTVSVGPYVDELKEGFNGSCAPADLETMLQLVNLYFTAPRKSADDFNSLMSKLHGQYDHILDNPQYFFQDKIQKVIFNNSIRRGLPTKEKLDMVDLDKAFKIYTERFGNAGDFTFVFVGNVDIDKLKPLVQIYLGSLPSAADRETWKDPGINKPTGKVVSHINMGNTPKTLVNIQYHSKLPWTEQDEYNFNSMVKVLNIMLRESLREDKGGVYGVGVSGSFIRRPQERYAVNIGFNADPPRADELIKLVYDKIEELKNNGTTEEKLNKVKETQRRERESDWKENAFWLNNIEYYDTYNTNIAQIHNLDKYIDNLKLFDIQAAAKKFLSGDNKIEVVLEPKKAE